MAQPRNPPPYKRKGLTDIFHKSRVIAHFVSSFVAMATRVGRSRLTDVIYLLDAQNFLLDAKISEISRTHFELQPIFCLKFDCHGNMSRLW